MSPAIVTCEQCSQQLYLPKNKHGRATCPKCGLVFEYPRQDSVKQMDVKASSKVKRNVRSALYGVVGFLFLLLIGGIAKEYLRPYTGIPNRQERLESAVQATMEREDIKNMFTPKAVAATAAQGAEMRLDDGRRDFAAIQKAVLHGNAMAQFILGNSYYYGKGVPKDTTYGVQWLKKAAIGGNVRAQRLLGQLYLFGHDVIHSRKTGCGLLLASAEQGDSYAVVVYNRECAKGQVHSRSPGIKIDEFRLVYPEYNDMTDYELSTAVHRARHSDLSYDQFARSFGGPLEEDPFITTGGEHITQADKPSVSPSELKNLEDEIRRLAKNSGT